MVRRRKHSNPSAASRAEVDTDVTLNTLHAAILDAKDVTLSLREDFIEFKTKDFAVLRQHVNDENANILRLLQGKVDIDHLPLTLFRSVGFRLLNKNMIRWGVGALAAWVVGTMAWLEGPGVFETIVRVAMRALQHV